MIFGGRNLSVVCFKADNLKLEDRGRVDENILKAEFASEVLSREEKASVT
jgi:hypothetical protein